MQEFFDFIWKVISEVFGIGGAAISLSEYTGWHFVALILCGTLIIIAIIGITALAIWLIWHILGAVFNILASIFSAKKRCSKIVCSSCGRTLDKCTCQKNKNRGYFRRLALYSKEKRDAQRAKKQAIKEARKKDK